MSKPPTSVRSIRLPNQLWDVIKADADARGEKVNTIVARHLRIAYRSGPVKVQDVVDVTVGGPLGAKAAKAVRDGPNLARAMREGFDHGEGRLGPGLTSLPFGPVARKPGEMLKGKK